MSGHVVKFEEALYEYLPLNINKRTADEIEALKNKIEHHKNTAIKLRFIDDGILQLIDYDDFLSNWKYIGGTSNSSSNKILNKIRHEDYLLCNYGIDELYINKGILQDHCVCGVKIYQRIFISDGKRVITIGNECVVTFFENECKYHFSKKCSICESYHNNRLGTLCNNCRIGKCMNCGIDINKNYKKCYSCKYKKTKHENLLSLIDIGSCFP